MKPITHDKDFAEALKLVIKNQDTDPKAKAIIDEIKETAAKALLEDTIKEKTKAILLKTEEA